MARDEVTRDELSALAAEIIARETGDMHATAHVNLVINGEHVSVAFEQGRKATLVHLIIEMRTALADPGAFEAELTRAVRMIAQS